MFDTFNGRRPEYQEILNRLSATDAPERSPIPVRVRVVWAEHGEQCIAGLALRREDRDGAIYIQIADPRFQFSGVWLWPADVDWEGKSGS